MASALASNLICFPRIGEYAKADDYNYANIGDLIYQEEFEDYNSIYAYIDEESNHTKSIFRKYHICPEYLVSFSFTSNKKKLECIFVGVTYKQDCRFRKSMKDLKMEMEEELVNYELICKQTLSKEYLIKIGTKTALHSFVEA